MPTINTMVSQASTVASLSTKFFGSNFAAANNSVLIRPGYNNFFNFLKSDFGGQPALTNMIESYRDNRESFNEEMRENMSSLKESSDKVKESTQETEKVDEVVDTDNDNNTGSALSTLGEFAIGNIPPQERNFANVPPPPPREKPQTEPPESQNALKNFAEEYLTAENAVNETTTTQNSDEDSRITEVKDLVRNFNNAMSYLNENRGMSNRMSALADNFSRNENLSASLRDIGISTNAEGFLAVNEAIFTFALNNDSDSVNSILGSEGLAGQLDRNINLANYQGDKLFTSILDFANQRQQDETESLYGNNAAYAKENTPRLFAMFT